MKATDIYRQDSLVFVLFENTRVIISTGNRTEARAVEASLKEVLDLLSDVTIEGRFT